MERDWVERGCDRAGVRGGGAGPATAPSPGDLERGRDHTILFAAKVAGGLASTGGGERWAGGWWSVTLKGTGDGCTGADADADADTGQLAARGPGLRVPHLAMAHLSVEYIQPSISHSSLPHLRPMVMERIPRCRLDCTFHLLGYQKGRSG